MTGKTPKLLHALINFFDQLAENLGHQGLNCVGRLLNFFVAYLNYFALYA